MQDLETESLWGQVIGEGILGKMENTRLDLFPSAMTTYSEYKKQYPNGLILKKENPGLPNSGYADYFSDRTKLGIFGRVDKYRRLNGKDKVIGIRSGDRQVAVFARKLKNRNAIVIEKVDPAVVATSSDDGQILAVFSLEQFGEDQAKKMTMLDGQLGFKDSQQRWNPQTGELLAGNGTDLPLVPFTPCFWFAWVSFFPDTDLIR